MTFSNTFRAALTSSSSNRSSFSKGAMEVNVSRREFLWFSPSQWILQLLNALATVTLAYTSTGKATSKSNCRVYLRRKVDVSHPTA